MAILPVAGKPAPKDMLVDLIRFEQEYYARTPDRGDSNRSVAFAMCGHRESSFHGSFNEAHILAITQAFCDYRCGQGTDGPLYINKDTHALSGLTQRTALEVHAVDSVDTVIQCDDNQRFLGKRH